MARTNNVSIPVYRSTISQYVITGNANSSTILFNIALSAESSSNLVGYLSSAGPTPNDVCTPFLSGLLATTNNTTLSTLSAVTGSISLTWPSIAGNQDYWANIATSSYIPATSTFTVILNFGSLNFISNTVMYLSGNTASIILSGGNAVNTLDNPFYTRPSVISSGAESNNQFRTVGEHCRRWNHMG